ncbi:MAG TPA: TM0106 family RecB-like putative nuclease [Terriglobales bacterium]|jgi:predicted RecB family nuclease|nr:TM0106 family RecB-like putative nuclease [Terriglobales bacterium]
MRLTASDFVSYRRPSPCDLRVFLRHRREQEAEPGHYELVLRRLGLRHENEHLATLGAFADVRVASLDEYVKKTADAIAKKVPVLYQPAFVATEQICGTDVEIVGVPDFLIFAGNGYVVRDSKMARRIDEENHPEILLQLQLYGWLYEKSSGTAPKELQVYGGTGEIVTIPYDGGATALRELERLLRIKQLSVEPYEPVGWTKCLGCGYTDRCWTQAEKNGDIALVYCVDQSLARTLHNQGIRTRKELLANFDAASLSELKRPYGNREQRVGKAAERILKFADAMEKEQEIVFATPAIPPHRNYVMFDLEGMPPHLDELDKIYLWGAQVFGENPTEFKLALSGFGADGDRDGWIGFLNNAKQIFETHGDVPWVHWAPYEQTYLRRYTERFGDPEGIAARVEANLLDLLTITRNSVVLPLPSLSLKVVEEYVGFERKEAEYGGGWAMATFIEATETSDEAKRTELMGKIVAYNREDLEATWAVFQWLNRKISPPSR